jgi:cobalt-zinc-cadmium efflux system outer membrane protein
MAGDISELEETALQLEAARKRESLVNYLRDMALLDAELKTLLGLEMEVEFKLSPSAVIIDQSFNLDVLLSTAFAAHPDLRAAEISIEAAGKRLGWERSKIFKITTLVDFNERGKSGPEFGPGFMFEPPVFNWNNGKVSRAAAQLEQAVKQYSAVKQQITLNVSKAYTNYVSAQKSLKIQRSNVLHIAETAADKAKRRYSVGEISYLAYLGFKGQLLVSRFNDIRCEAELRLSAARLRHSIGFKQVNNNVKSTNFLN